jgi:hypothetical protein
MLSDLSPGYVAKRVKKLMGMLKEHLVPGHDSLTREAQKNATILFGTLVRSMLASKRVLREHKLSQLVMYLTLSPFAETDVPASLPRYFFLSVFIYSLPLWIETWLEHVVPQRETAREIWKRFGTPLSIGFVLASAAFILVAASPNPSDFIYFQF